jgi:hypothetical protein
MSLQVAISQSIWIERFWAKVWFATVEWVWMLDARLFLMIAETRRRSVAIAFTNPWKPHVIASGMVVLERLECPKWEVPFVDVPLQEFEIVHARALLTAYLVSEAAPCW